MTCTFQGDGLFCHVVLVVYDHRIKRWLHCSGVGLDRALLRFNDYSNNHQISHVTRLSPDADSTSCPKQFGLYAAMAQRGPVVKMAWGTYAGMLSQSCALTSTQLKPWMSHAEADDSKGFRKGDTSQWSIGWYAAHTSLPAHGCSGSQGRARVIPAGTQNTINWVVTGM